jgi:hypothetical protein
LTQHTPFDFDSRHEGEFLGVYFLEFRKSTKGIAGDTGFDEFRLLIEMDEKIKKVTVLQGMFPWAELCTAVMGLAGCLLQKHQSTYQ